MLKNFKNVKKTANCNIMDKMWKGNDYFQKSFRGYDFWSIMTLVSFFCTMFNWSILSCHQVFIMDVVVPLYVLIHRDLYVSLGDL